jgi:mannose-1-phosphate guanylyltransferase
MKAVVLVGGEGTRLRPLTETIPKPLLPLMGRSFLHHVLDHLAAHGVHEVILSSPYLEERFTPFIESRHGDPLITWITEESPLGTGGAVLNALGNVEETFFVLNGDILTDLDLTAMAAAHDASGASVSISTMHVDDARPFGLVITDETGRVLEFREKPADLIPGDINAGTYLIDPDAVADFERGVNTSIERDVFPAVIGRGDLVRAFASQCYWMDLGTPGKYLRAHFDILEGKVRGEEFTAPYLEGAEVDLTASLGRWVVAGRGVVVGPRAQIEDSVLLTGASVAAGAKVRDSILGPGAKVGEGAMVVGTVLGEGAEVSAGDSVADARISTRTEAP